jgi:hypothetical protein
VREHKELAAGLIVVGASTLIGTGPVYYFVVVDAKHPKWWIVYLTAVAGVALGGLGIRLYVGFPRVPVFVPTRPAIRLWWDKKRGRTTAITLKQQVYLDALAKEKEGYIKKRQRRSVADVDAEIRKVWRDGAWFDEQTGLAAPEEESVSTKPPALLVTIDRPPQWSNFDHRARILEQHLSVTNQAQVNKTLEGFYCEGSGLSITGDAQVRAEVEKRKALRAELRRHSILEPGDTVEGWVIHAFRYEPNEMPTYTLGVVDERDEKYEATESD